MAHLEKPSGCANAIAGTNPRIAAIVCGGEKRAPAAASKANVARRIWLRLGPSVGPGAKAMAEFPAMPLWTDAYLADTGHLTTLEHGAYLLLLMAMWRSSEGCLPADDVRMARVCRLRLDQWRRMKPTLAEFLSLDETSMTYSQARITDERERCTSLRQNQSLKAQAKWLKYRNARDAAASKRQCRTDASLNPNPSTPLTNKDSLEAPPLHVGDETETPAGTNGTAKPKANRRKPAVPLPPDWRPDLDYARGLGMTDREINWQANSMVDRARMKDERFVDWSARWRNWCRTYVNNRVERTSH